ncbi:MAG: MBL fold metallo-hydrolase [Cytophagales bacterium]|nr:MBL fold metallo-hydrolase [Cytophagales bacterium]
MTITFLGTGASQGTPTVVCRCEVCRSLDFRDKRLRSSIHLSINNKSIIIDACPDFRQQVIGEQINSLDALLFTHEHKDHTGGLDDVRGFNFKQKKALPIYARTSVAIQLEKTYNYIFAKDVYPGIPQLKVNLIENKPFSIDNITVLPIEVLHYRLPVFGFRFNNFTYITDANFIAEEALEKIKGSTILVVNALQKEPHKAHFNLKQAIELTQQVQPKETYLTHISHKLGLHKEISKELPHNIKLAYDGLKIHL